MLGKKANQRPIFQESASHFQVFKASKWAICSSNLASSAWQELRTLQLSYCPIISHHLCDRALGCTWLAAALQGSTLSNRGNFLLRHFQGNAITHSTLYGCICIFILADAAFSFFSVLTSDGGEVLTVQKFRQSERCVLSSGTGCCCSVMHRREHSNVPLPMSPTAHIKVAGV